MKAPKINMQNFGLHFKVWSSNVFINTMLKTINNKTHFENFDFNYVYSWAWDRNFPTG